MGQSLAYWGTQPIQFVGGEDLNEHTNDFHINVNKSRANQSKEIGPHIVKT